MNRFFQTSPSSSKQEPLPFATSPCPKEEKGAFDNQQIGKDTPTSTSSKKIPKKRTSKVWLYFDAEDDKATCKLCKAQLSNKYNCGTSSLARHLIRAHKNDVDNNLFDESRQQFSGKGKDESRHQNIEAEEVRCQLAKMVVGAELPFNFVQSHYFTDYMKIVQPRFGKVSRNTVYEDGYKVYEHEIIALKHLFAELTSKISLTMDLWMGRGSLHYLCITAHWINENFLFEKRIIDFSLLDYPHDGLSIYQTIMSCLSYWEINDKIMSISLDNASTSGRDTEFLAKFLKPMIDSKFMHASCICHVLHLCVSDVMHSLRPHIDLVRNCLSYICSSSTRMQKYKKMVQNAKMKFKIPYLDLKTKLSSTYRMLMEALPYASIITRFIREESNGRVNLISESDWKIINVLAPLLQAFNNVSSMMSDRFYPTSNFMLTNMVKIVKLFDAHRNDKHVKEIIEKMELKWLKHYDTVPFCAIFCCIFDPRCKLDGCVYLVEEYYKCLGPKTDVDYRKEISDILDELVKKYSSHGITDATPSSGKCGTFKLLEKLKKQKSDSNLRGPLDLNHYLNLPLENDSDYFDVLEWWKAKQSHYPILSMIARDLLTCQMSSVASEGCFSAGARTVTDRSSRSTPKSTKFCMLLKDWLDEEYRSKNLEKVGGYKMPEKMKEDYFDDDDDDESAIETTTTATGEEQDQDIERDYFPNPDYYYFPNSKFYL